MSGAGEGQAAAAAVLFLAAQQSDGLRGEVAAYAEELWAGAEQWDEAVAHGAAQFQEHFVPLGVKVHLRLVRRQGVDPT